MKKYHFFYLALFSIIFFTGNIHGQTKESVKVEADDRKVKSNFDQEKKAEEWVAALDLNNESKEYQLRETIAIHLKIIRDWHNDHPYTTVPAGINPLDGKPLSDLDRQIIANSAMPAMVHQNLMKGLRKELKEEQVEAILDKYTVGKVDFTMAGYHAIVPDLTEEEEKTIRGYMEQAREQAIDYKNMNQISGIFEIYKTKAEQYLNSNGRNWREMYKSYVKEANAKKAERNVN